MTKKTFFKLLNNTTKTPKGIIIINSTTKRDEAYNRSYYSIAIYYEGTIDTSVIISKKGNANSTEATKDLNHYKKYFELYKSQLKTIK